MSIERTIETRPERPGVNSSLEDLLDLEFEEYCALQAGEDVTLEEVHKATASIPGSMAQAIVEDERAERF